MNMVKRQEPLSIAVKLKIHAAIWNITQNRAESSDYKRLAVVSIYIQLTEDCNIQ